MKTVLTQGDIDVIVKCESHTDEVIAALGEAVGRAAKAIGMQAENYAKQNENISVEEMIQLWNGIAERNNLLVPTWQPSPNDNQPFANKRRIKIEWGA